MFEVRDEETGEVLETFAPEAYPAGEKGARVAASIFAKRCAKGGQTVRLTVEGVVRRYAYSYWVRSNDRPYRVAGPCGTEADPHWVWPGKRAGAPGKCHQCRRAEGQTDTQKAAVAQANRERVRDDEPPRVARPRRGDQVEYVRADGRVEIVTVTRAPANGRLSLRTEDGRSYTRRPAHGPGVRGGWRRRGEK